MKLGEERMSDKCILSSSLLPVAINIEEARLARFKLNVNSPRRLCSASRRVRLFSIEVDLNYARENSFSSLSVN